MGGGAEGKQSDTAGITNRRHGDPEAKYRKVSIENTMVIKKENQESGCGMKKRSYMEKHREAE